MNFCMLFKDNKIKDMEHKHHKSTKKMKKIFENSLFVRVATSNTKLDISLYLFFFINFFFFLYFILSQSIHFCHKYIHYL